MTGLIRIVKGNEYPFKIYMESMGYVNGTTLRGTAVDLRTVDNLKVTAVHMYCRKELTHVVADDGSYLTAVIPPDCCMPLGNWGIRITGEINGLKVASAERAVFSLVKWNGQDYVPPTIMDGEGSYVLNMKFGAGDSEYTPVDPTGDYAGWIGFTEFDTIADIDLSDSGLSEVNDVRGNRTLTNSSSSNKFLVVTNEPHTLTITFAGIPIAYETATGTGSNTKKYYYTPYAQQSSQVVGDYEINIV